MRATLLPALAASMLAACTAADSMGLNGAASMRVEVEVYKGPLGQEIPFQQAELAAVIKEAVRALDSWSTAAVAYRLQNNQLCHGNVAGMRDCRHLEEAIKAARESIEDFCSTGIKVPGAIFEPRLSRDFPTFSEQRPWLRDRDYLAGEHVSDVCVRHFNVADGKPREAVAAAERNLGAELQQDRRDGPKRRRPAGSPTSDSRPSSVNEGQSIEFRSERLGDFSVEQEPDPSPGDGRVDETARLVTEAAAALQAKAFRIETSFVGDVPADRAVRKLLVDFKLLASEYGNQIRARNSVLEKEVAAGQMDGRRLPTSDFLRDSSPTDFLQLYEWYDATSAGRLKTLFHSWPSVDERIRIAERLFADHYWEKVNEVYASGQGDVSMAFIKNEIGNWDLKSFGNDPEELLAAYSSAASAALKAVADLARGGVTGFGGAALSRSEQLVDLGTRLATGQSSQTPTLAGMDAARLHERARAKLTAATERAGEREAEVLETKTAAEAALEAAKAEKVRLEGELKTEQELAETARTALAACLEAAAGACDDEQKAVADADNRVSEKQAAIGKADSAIAGHQGELAKSDARLAEIRTELVQALRDVLDDHLTLVAAFQEFVAGPAEPAAPATVTPPAAGIAEAVTETVTNAR